MTTGKEACKCAMDFIGVKEGWIVASLIRTGEGYVVTVKPKKGNGYLMPIMVDKTTGKCRTLYMDKKGEEIVKKGEQMDIPKEYRT